MRITIEDVGREPDEGKEGARAAQSLPLGKAEKGLSLHTAPII
jgi:hypothetical protein